MAKDPAFLFYTGDFTTGTQFFTNEQIGIYLRLLMAQHQHGHLSEKQMLHISKSYDVDIFGKFTKDGNGLFFNERLELEITKRKQYSLSRGTNRKGNTKSTSKPKNISKSYDIHMENENENKDINKDDSVIENDFDFFWNEYDKKVGDKEKLKKKWISLSKSDQDKIFTHIEQYKIAQPDKKFRKDPATYLNNKSWNDEIIISNATNNTTNGKLSRTEKRKLEIERIIAYAKSGSSETTEQTDKRDN